jgi:hypothetical protein
MSSITIQTERWSATRGSVSVTCRIWTRQLRLRQRHEMCAMVSDIRTPRGRLRIREELLLRTYTASQLERLFDKVDQFEPVATDDFTYDPLSPISVAPDTQDVVYVLRRR